MNHIYTKSNIKSMAVEHNKVDVITRFPPEPNGLLHLGHLKAMNVDFTYHKNCKSILRLDDTNPETETQEFVDSIIESVKWLGYKPYKITYTSDYFEQLIKYATDLINKGLAYVDTQKFDDIKKQRYDGTDSPFRNMTIPENIKLFEMMKTGEMKDCVLRLKINMKDANPNMRDPVAYRCKSAKHYRTGDKYKIYPSYDFSHGIVDSIEGITHSYCTFGI